MNQKHFFGGMAVIASISTVLACGKSGSPTNFQIPPSVDSTSDLISKLSDTTLRSHGGSLKLGSDGSFELVDTRNATFSQNPAPSDQGYHVNCGVRITGTFQYLATQITQLSSNSYSTSHHNLIAVIQNAVATSAESEGSDVSDTTATHLCDVYAQSLVEKGKFNWTLASYSKDYVLLGMDLNVKSETEEVTSYSLSPLGNSDDSGRYFVRPGAEIDATSQVLADIGGIYSAISGSYGSLELRVDSKSKSLRLTNLSCGLANEMNISKIIVNDQGNLRLLATHATTANVPVVSEPTLSADCGNYQNVMTGAVSQGFSLSYLGHVCLGGGHRSSCAETLLNLAGPPTGNVSSNGVGSIFYFYTKGF